MRCPILVVVALAIGVSPARGQLQGRVSVEETNRRICGRVLDFTHNHGADRRLDSPILGMPRDLYVYLPPSYTPRRAYPLILYFHGGFGDEHAFLEEGRLEYLDGLIVRGQFPPCIVACPDGTYTGRNCILTPLSLYVNGCGGRVEDHVMREVLPFLTAHFSIRRERGAHAILGLSSGGLGALSLAIRYRTFFGAVAVLSAAANLRYGTCTGNYFDDFDPATYRPREHYDPREVVGTYANGLVKIRARAFARPVFGSGDAVIARVEQVNPADLLFTSGIRPGELAFYVNYAGRDNFNFDAQSESFAWLATQRGIAVTLVPDPEADHGLDYFRENQKRAWHWLAGQLLPPAEAVPIARAAGGPGR